jgi:hypothetical protein
MAKIGSRFAAKQTFRFCQLKPIRQSQTAELLVVYRNHASTCSIMDIAVFDFEQLVWAGDRVHLVLRLSSELKVRL